MESAVAIRAQSPAGAPATPMLNYHESIDIHRQELRSFRQELQGKVPQYSRPRQGSSYSDSYLPIIVEDRGLWRLSIGSCLFLEFAHQFCYLGVVYTLATYLTILYGFAIEKSGIVINALFTLTPLFSVLAAFLADGKVGRAKIVLASSSILAVGACCIAVSAIPSMFDDYPRAPSDHSFAYFFTGVAFVAVGNGGLKSTLSPLTAEQVPILHPSRNDLLSTLFRVIYACVTSGSALAILVCPFLRASVGPQTQNEEDTGYYVPYFTCCGVMCIAVAVFLASVHRIHSVPQSTALLSTVFASIRTWIFGVKDMRQSITVSDTTGLLRHALRDPTVDDQTYATRVRVVAELKQAIVACRTFALLPLYWLIMNQGITNMMVQSEWCDRPDFIVPEAMANLSSLTAIITLPLLHCFIHRLTTPRRMCIGFLCASLAICYSGYVQIALNNAGHYDGHKYTPTNGKGVSIFVQVPAYVLQGVAACFVDVTALEATFTLAPKSMKSVVLSMYWLCSSAAGAAGLIISIWASPATLTFVFFSLGGAMMLLSGVFYYNVSDIDNQVRDEALHVAQVYRPASEYADP